MTKTSFSDFHKSSEFFVGIDSDGCAFDTMEIKHKECFIPNIVNVWDLQAVSSLARETAEFVNLYSQWRGVNRFPGLVMVFDLLAQRPEALERGYAPPQVDALRQWIAAETRLANPALAAKAKETGEPSLARALEWSQGVNADIAKIVRNVPPFPHVRQGLQKMQGKCDVIVCSATPAEALDREWQEHDIAQYVNLICGQEMGTKKEHLHHCAAGKYASDRVLMIGDALGDHKAAKDNGFLFYPINPGHESESWRRLHDEALDLFLAGKYAGPYEQQRLAEFQSLLPSTPPWKTISH